MTREEAIKAIQDFTGWFKKDKPIYKALEMAIQALSQVAICPSAGVNCEDCPAYEPCDAVSRDALITKLVELIKTERSTIEIKGKLIPMIQDMPPVTQKSGKWITKPHVYGVAYCSECDFELKIDDTNYCPNCGAKMESEG